MSTNNFNYKGALLIGCLPDPFSSDSVEVAFFDSILRAFNDSLGPDPLARDALYAKTFNQDTNHRAVAIESELLVNNLGFDGNTV